MLKTLALAVFGWPVTQSQLLVEAFGYNDSVFPIIRAQSLLNFPYLSISKKAPSVQLAEKVYRT